jgi:molybdate transport system ATP-binding protein
VTPPATIDLTVDVPGRLTAVLTAAAGEVIAVIGPNGAGKSTLLHAAAGLVPAGGPVIVDGLDQSGVEVRDRRVGLVFQDRLLFPHLTARDNVAFGPRARGASRQRAGAVADDWLQRFGVAHLAGRRPAELSGGQAQRVAIARALATDPRLLLLDEPFAGLDVTVAAALRVELARHLADFPGITLLVTHDPLDALTLASRVLVLDEGRVAQQGTPAQVAAEPQTEHVARLVGLNVLTEGERMASFSPRDVTVSLGRPEGSARWRWAGRVVSAVPHGDAVRLLVRTADEAERDLLADVTPAATAELGLAPGQEVWLSVKATAMRHYDATSDAVAATRDRDAPGGGDGAASMRP